MSVWRLSQPEKPKFLIDNFTQKRRVNVVTDLPNLLAERVKATSVFPGGGRRRRHEAGARTVVARREAEREREREREI